VTALWTPQTDAYQQAQGERKLLAIRKLQQSVEGVLLQLQRAAATDARMDTDPRSRKELHAFTRLRHRLQRQLAMHLHQLQQWCSAPGHHSAWQPWTRRRWVSPGTPCHGAPRSTPQP